MKTNAESRDEDGSEEREADAAGAHLRVVASRRAPESSLRFARRTLRVIDEEGEEVVRWIEAEGL